MRPPLPTCSLADPLTVYVARRCPDCRAVERFLDGLGVPYRTVDIEDDPDADRLVRAYGGGHRRVPTVRLGPYVDTDPSLLALGRLVARAHAAPDPPRTAVP